MNIVSRPNATFTSREFNQDTARAKRATEHGPVFITTRGEPTHVLMTIEDFRKSEMRRREEKPLTLREALIDRNHGDDFDFDFPELKDQIFKGFEFD